MDDHAILAECERDQYMAKDQYEAALDGDSPFEVSAMVERHYRVVAANHGRIRIPQNERDRLFLWFTLSIVDIRINCTPANWNTMHCASCVS
jgi:hypothetical protein